MEVAQRLVLAAQHVDRQELEADLKSVPTAAGGVGRAETLDVALQQQDVVLLKIGDRDLGHACGVIRTHRRVIDVVEGDELTPFIRE